MTSRVLILGAGFGGLELSACLSEQLGTSVAVTLLDKNDSFVFGYSKFEVLFGRQPMEAVRLPYSTFAKPGVRLLQEEVKAIDPVARRVTTNAGVHEADYLVIAMGADYDPAATPGLIEHGNDFYSLDGVQKLRERLPAFQGGRVVIGMAAWPVKCPPAPSECALMMHDHLSARGLRDKSEITLVVPMAAPVPPSPDTSKALIAEFAARGIKFIAGRAVTSLADGGKSVVLDDGTALPCDLYLGVPKHRAPQAIVDSGMLEETWVKADPRTLETKWERVYAIGDIAALGIPKAGVFAEAAARAVAESIVASVRGESRKGRNAGKGQCYIEFGEGRIAIVDVDFLSGPKPIGLFQAPSAEGRAHKIQFGSSRKARWFGL